MWLDDMTATGITAVTLVVLLYFAQLRGWVYFRPHVDGIRADFQKQLDDLRKDRDARLAEVREDRDKRLADKAAETENLWAALNASEQHRHILAAQNEKMLEGLETTVAVIRAIPTPAPPGA